LFNGSRSVARGSAWRRALFFNGSRSAARGSAWRGALFFNGSTSAARGSAWRVARGGSARGSAWRAARGGSVNKQHEMVANKSVDDDNGGDGDMVMTGGDGDKQKILLASKQTNFLVIFFIAITLFKERDLFTGGFSSSLLSVLSPCRVPPHTRRAWSLMVFQDLRWWSRRFFIIFCSCPKKY